METEREKYLRRLYELIEYRRQPGFGIVVSLSDERERREARANAKRVRRLAQLPGREDGPERKE